MSSHYGGSHFASSHYLSNHYGEIAIIQFVQGAGLDEFPLILRGAQREEEEFMLLMTMFVAYIENEQ